jgi:lysophospholipase L1-like esterase
MAVIYCFGDSITYGAWDIKEGGWANQLRGYVDELQAKDPELYYLTYNLGIPGETSDGFLKRFETELAARAKAGRGTAGPGEALFILAFGANDYTFIPSANEFVVTPEKFVTNMQSAINIAKKTSSKILLLNITPCDEAICKKNYGDRKLRINKNVEIYNSLLQDLANKNNCKLVDVYSVFTTNQSTSLLSEDGLHPNDAGHELIFEKVREVLSKII